MSRHGGLRQSVPRCLTDRCNARKGDEASHVHRTGVKDAVRIVC